VNRDRAPTPLHDRLGATGARSRPAEIGCASRRTDPDFLFQAGFHSYDPEPGDATNGNRERRFVYNVASWHTLGLVTSGSLEDIAEASSEMSAVFGDPFVDNATPWLGNLGYCFNQLEPVGLSNAIYAIPFNGRTYHPQNEALLPWFALESPSSARAGAYSFPDETAPSRLVPCQ
jgi:hypothetical protein